MALSIVSSIAPVLSIVDYPSLKPTASTPTSSGAVVSFTLPDAVNSNGPVDSCWFIVQRMPSENKRLGTYYESANAVRDWPEYPAVKVSIPQVSHLDMNFVNRANEHPGIMQCSWVAACVCVWGGGRGRLDIMWERWKCPLVL